MYPSLHVPPLPLSTKQEQSRIPRITDCNDYNCHNSSRQLEKCSKGVPVRTTANRLTTSRTAVDELPNAGSVEAGISKPKRERDGSHEVTAGAN